MYAEAQIRQKLIDSAFSSMEAEELLLKIADDAEHYGGDAPMRAAYFASQFPSTFLATHEPKLLALLTTVNGYSGHIALALGRTKSPRGKAVLLSELGDGSRFDAWLFKKGLAEYE